MSDTLIETLKAVGQEHLLKFRDELSSYERVELETDVQDVDWSKLDMIYKEQVLPHLDGCKIKAATKIDCKLLKELPAESVSGTTRCDNAELSQYRDAGLVHIDQGKVAALLLAGGQGTRLGVDYPKGMYDVGLPSHKSLFELQAQRIVELCQRSSSSTGSKSRIIWYIMTSEATMIETKQFFEAHKFFGLPEGDVIFFEQGTIPCFDFSGKVLMAKKSRVARSPDGNGGLYDALHKKGILEHMKANGVEYVHVYCVDNILVRVCDPVFLGYCISRDVDAGAKVVEKILPTELVGTICKVSDKFKVIEYSEIPDEVAQRRNELTGKLAFNAGNICDHFFKISFLETIKGSRQLVHHLAIKKIPHIDMETGEKVRPSEPNGIKLEKFIFDVFEFTDKFAAWEVRREDEFSPLKNADGTEKDNPTTARKALMRAYDIGLFRP